MPSIHPQTPLVSPIGWIEAWRAQPGDLLYDASGKPTPVARVTRETPNRAVQVRISGPPLRASVDHDLVLGTRWKSESQWPGEGERRDAVVNERVQIEGEDPGPEGGGLPLDPWAYGLWRTAGIEDAIAIPAGLEDRAAEMLIERGLRVRRRADHGNVTYLYLDGLLERLHTIRAFDSPVALAYRRASVESRRDFLAGALDGKVSFRKGLRRHLVIMGKVPIIDDLAEIATSLGWRSSAVHATTSPPFVRILIDHPVMYLRDMDLAVARAAAVAKPRGMFGPYYVHEHAEIDPEEYVDLRTEAGTYLMGRAMAPVRDW